MMARRSALALLVKRALRLMCGVVPPDLRRRVEAQLQPRQRKVGSRYLESQTTPRASQPPLAGTSDPCAPLPSHVINCDV